MATLDDELLQSAEEDARAVEYIKTHMPQELQEKFTEDNLYYFLDVIVEYYAESGVLDAEPDSDGYINIDEETVAAYVTQKARKEGIGEFDTDDILLVVQNEMDFEESLISD